MKKTGTWESQMTPCINFNQVFKKTVNRLITLLWILSLIRREPVLCQPEQRYTNSPGNGWTKQEHTGGSGKSGCGPPTQKWVHHTNLERNQELELDHGQYQTLWPWHIMLLLWGWSQGQIWRRGIHPFYWPGIDIYVMEGWMILKNKVVILWQ